MKQFFNLISALRKARIRLSASLPPADLFAAATVMARKGRYEGAGRLLQIALARKQCTEPQALDLQARMYIQQGMHLHAESCWRKAQSLDGANPKYEEALSRIRASRIPFLRPIHVLFSMCVFGLLVAALWHVISHGRALERHQNSHHDAILRVRNDVVALEVDSSNRHQKLADAVSVLEQRMDRVHSELADTLDTMATRGGEQKRTLDHMDAEHAVFPKRLEATAETLGNDEPSCPYCDAPPRRWWQFWKRGS